MVSETSSEEPLSVTSKSESVSENKEEDGNGNIPSSEKEPLLFYLQEDEICDSDCGTGDDLYTRLITKAPYMPGIGQDLDPIEEIPWIDYTLVEESLEFHKRNFAFAFMANTFALMIGFCVKPNSAVILRTGKLHDPELSFQRFLSTAQRIGKFMMISFDREKSYKALDTVRKMHNHASKKGRDFHPSPKDLNLCNEQWKLEIAEAMRKDLGYFDTSSAPKEILTWDPPVPVSQFDMVTTQFGFIGTMWLFPRVFGIQDREKEMRGVLHTWAIFGRLLGIKDEFNVCLKPDPEVYDKLFRNIVVESLKTMDETVVTIQHAFIKAFRSRMPLLTYKAVLYIGLHDLEGYTGENLWKLMTWQDKLSVKFWMWWLWSMRNIRGFKFINNIITGLWLQYQFWRHLKTSLWD